MEEDFYAILGVDRDADSVTIRQAFKRLALTHHPDKVGEADRKEAEIRFKVISEAYETLINEESRMLYDAETQFGNGNEWQDFYSTEEDPFGFGSQFTANYHHPANHANARTKDVIIEVELTLEEVYRGKMLKFNSERQVLCRRCEGTGGRPGARKRTCRTCSGFGTTKRTQMVGPGMLATSTILCPVCNGDGQVYRNKDLCRRCRGKKVQDLKTLVEIYIPKGVKNGHRIVIEGHSDEEPGKAPGDLVILVLVQNDHPVFRREGYDLYTSAQVSLKEALTGFSRPLVTHLDGRELKPTIARGEILKPGSVIRLLGEGLIKEDMINGTEATGDLYIQVDVVFPESIERHIIDKLAALLTFEDDDESDRSDDTLDGTATAIDPSAKPDFKKASCSPGIPVDHEILEESDLPEYQDDANNEPEPAISSNQQSHEFDYSAYRSRNNAFPGCTTM